MAYPSVSVEADAVTDDRTFAPEIAVTRQFSADSMASVGIELTNTATTNVEIGLSFITPFDSLHGHLTDGSTGLYLVPGSGFVRGDETIDVPPRSSTTDPPKRGASLIPDAPRNGCWRATDSPTTRESGTLWNADPGATLHREHAVLDEPESETCLQPGAYRFEVDWIDRPMHDARGVMGDQQYTRAGDSTSYQ